jgi:PAS domain S-box-containing protein
MRLNSLFLLCTGAIAVVVAVFALRIAFFELRAYRASLRGEIGVSMVAAALTAMEKVSLERGPSNAIIGDPQRDPSELRASLARARSESDFAVSRLQSLLQADPTERHRSVLEHLAATVRQLQVGRGNVDALAGQSPEQRQPEEIRSAVQSMIRVVLVFGPVVIDLNSETERADPALSNPLSAAYLAAELREQAGQLGSQITASIATRGKLSEFEVEELDRSRGRIEVLHDLLRQRTQQYLDNPRMLRAIGRMDDGYFHDGLVFVEQTIEKGKQTGDYGITTAQFAERYVPLMSSVLDLRDLILNIARDQAGAGRAAARGYLAAAATGYALLLAILGVMLLRLGRRVMDAFATTTDVIVAIADGKLDTPVPTTPRRDEIGEMLRSIQVLKEGMIKHRQMEITLRLSEERFRSAMHNSAIGMAMVALDSRWIEVNPSLCRILGYSREELLGADCTFVVHPEELDQDRECTRQMLSGHMATCERERRYVHKNGHTVLTQLNASVIRDDEGKPHYLVSQIQDIGERKRAVETTARLAAIVESSDDAIIGKTLEGIVTTWNSGAERLYGFTHEEAAGRPVSFIIPPGQVDDTAMILDMIRRGQRIDHYETLRRRKDGALVNISLTVSPIKDSTGQITGASAIARDITEHKRAEAERERLIGELQDALANVKTLRGLIPICASCKKIRDDTGYWNQIESYIKQHSQAQFSHGICPECAQKLYPDIWRRISNPKTGEGGA